MIAHNHRTLASCALACAASILCGVSSAQVGPSKGNVKPVKPVDTGKPEVRVHTLPPRKPPVDPARLAAAKRWQDGELDRIEKAVKAVASLQAPRLETVHPPVEPPIPPVPMPELTYRQRVTLQFVREDGAPYDSKLVGVTAPGLEAKRTASQLDLDGPVTKPGEGEVLLKLPPDWAFVKSDDMRLALKDAGIQESRAPLEPRPAAHPADSPAAAPLFNSDQERDALRRGRSRPQRPVPVKPSVPSPYSTPAASCGVAIGRILEARLLVSGSAPVAPDASLEARRSAWINLDRAMRSLQEVEAPLRSAERSLASFRAKNPARAILEEKYRVNYDRLSDVISLCHVRRAGYYAEAAWWRAQCERPRNPDRSAALQALKSALGSGVKSVELSDQMARYTDVTAREQMLAQRMQAGDFAPKPTPRFLVTRQLTRTIPVMRTVVDFRIAETDIHPGDSIVLAKDPTKPLPFKQDNGYWRATAPRNLVKKGDILRITRKTEGTELEGETVAEQVDPYAPQGNDIRRPVLRLSSIKSFSVATQGDESLVLFEELAPIDEDNTKLREARRKAAKDSRQGEDGSWWVTCQTAPVSFRVRPSPYPEDLQGRKKGGRSVGQSVGDFFKKIGGKSDRNKKLGGRVIVDAVRLDGASAGQVAGIHVGTPAAVVENALGGSVPPSGVIRYLNGSLEIGVKNGLVEYIEVRRNLTEILGKPLPPVATGTVADLNYDANRLHVPLGPKFQPQPGMELLVQVAGHPLPEQKNGEHYRAIVLDRTATEVVCKIVRKNKQGVVMEDADWELLRCLPPADSNAVILRTPSTGS